MGLCEGNEEWESAVQIPRKARACQPPQSICSAVGAPSFFHCSKRPTTREPESTSTSSWVRCWSPRPGTNRGTCPVGRPWPGLRNRVRRGQRIRRGSRGIGEALVLAALDRRVRSRPAGCGRHRRYSATCVSTSAWVSGWTAWSRWFRPERGYPVVDLDGIALRDRIWFSLNRPGMEEAGPGRDVEGVAARSPTTSPPARPVRAGTSNGHRPAFLPMPSPATTIPTNTT